MRDFIILLTKKYVNFEKNTLTFSFSGDDDNKRGLKKSTFRPDRVKLRRIVKTE